MPTDQEIRTESVLNRELAFRIDGSDPSAIVFIHGFGCDHRDWDAQIAEFSDRYQAIACDLPGHGLSERPIKESIAGLAAAVSELRCRHAKNRTVLVGHSMGCRVALESYRRMPERVSGIVLVEGSWVGETGRDPVNQRRAQTGSMSTQEIILQLFSEMFESDGSFKQMAMDRAGSMSMDFVDHLLPTISAWDLEFCESVLTSMNVPVLIIQSTFLDPESGRQSLTGPSQSRWLEYAAQRAANLETVIVFGTRHFPQVERAASVNAALKTFLERTLGKSAD